MAVVDEQAVEFWEGWWIKWHHRIRCLNDGSTTPRSRGRGRRRVRAADVSTAWTRLFMPAVDPEYVVPDWWRALSVEQKRTGSQPQLVLRPRRVPPASERSPGFSVDDVGPYLKLPNGRVNRDRRTAAQRLWRRLDPVPDLRRIVGWLPGRRGRVGRLVKGRTPDRVLDALVCYGLVRAGMSQVGFDRYGPASQREQQDRFIERYGLLDTGLVFQVAHSGTTVWRSTTMTDMLVAAKAGAFDLLLAGYSDRWQRNLRRTLELLEDGLHPVGAALVMCDRRILSSDPRDWDELVAEAAGAERYSRRLAERISDGYAAKFDQRSDPGGHAALGFRRSAEPPHALEIDPATIGQAVALFERYALGTVSSKRLAEETGLAASRIRCILMNPLYNGWVRRLRGRSAIRRAATWRDDPPVSDALWARVEDVRRVKTRGGGTRNRGRVDLLGGLLECVCGRRVRSDGTFADGRHRKLHPEPCDAWGRHARLADVTWEPAVLEQLAGVRLDDATIAAVVCSLGSSQRPIEIERGRTARQLGELALEHAAEAIDDATYLSRAARTPMAADAAPGVPADGPSLGCAPSAMQFATPTYRPSVRI